MREHREAAPGRVVVAIVTVSDTRTPETDEGGRALREILTAAGHEVRGGRIVRDDDESIRDALEAAVSDPGVHAVVFTGGTGVSPRDRTIEVVEPLLEKRLPGFGEIFRALSYAEIGPAAMLSRATAGVRRGRAVFALPGSPAAVRLAASRLVGPEIAHLAGLLRPADRTR